MGLWRSRLRWWFSGRPGAASLLGQPATFLAAGELRSHLAGGRAGFGADPGTRRRSVSLPPPRLEVRLPSAARRDARREPRKPHRAERLGHSRGQSAAAPRPIGCSAWAVARRPAPISTTPRPGRRSSKAISTRPTRLVNFGSATPDFPVSPPKNIAASSRSRRSSARSIVSSCKPA